MLAYYNEHDPKAAAWLRELINRGLVAPGVVDERSIVDVRPGDLDGFTQCHFFAGIGVWSYALRLAGWPDDRPVWTGSCPCQPFSNAGKGDGFADERHLWPAWFQLVAQRQPPVVFGEQVASKDGLAWFDLVQADLEGAGYAVGGADLCAAGVGAPHIRQRLWFVADAEHGGRAARQPQRPGASSAVPPSAPGVVANTERPGREGGLDAQLLGAGWRGEGRLSLQPRSVALQPWADADWVACRDGKNRPVEPGTSPLAHGAPARMVRLRGYGNSIVAQAGATFISSYLDLTHS